MTLTHTFTRTHTIDMIWTDFETNGIPEEGPVIPLEVGIMLTDKEGYEIDSFQSLVMPYEWGKYLDNANKVVLDMHRKSGLLEDLNKAEQELGRMGAVRRYRPVEVQERIFNWLEGHDLTAPKVFPLTGSTINFDRTVMLEHFLELHNWFHYRNQDISTLKNLCKLLNPKVAARLPKDPDKKHRPLDDIRASIREYNFYRENFLFEG